MVSGKNTRFSAIKVARSATVMASAMERVFELEREVKKLRHHVSVLSKRNHALSEEKKKGVWEARGSEEVAVDEAPAAMADVPVAQVGVAPEEAEIVASEVAREETKIVASEVAPEEDEIVASEVAPGEMDVVTPDVAQDRAPVVAQDRARIKAPVMEERRKTGRVSKRTRKGKRKGKEVAKVLETVPERQEEVKENTIPIPTRDGCCLCENEDARKLMVVNLKGWGSRDEISVEVWDHLVRTNNRMVPLIERGLDLPPGSLKLDEEGLLEICDCVAG